jgi:hypothetical protein
MLFKFGKFWKSLCFVVGTWIFYGICGFEFTTITLLSLIFISTFKDTKKFI